MLAKGRGRWAVSQKRGSSYVFGLSAHTVHIHLIDLLFQIWVKWNTVYSKHSFLKSSHLPSHKLISKNYGPICHLRLYLSAETISCRLLQRTATMDVDCNLRKFVQPFQVLVLCLQKSPKIILVIDPWWNLFDLLHYSTDVFFGYRYLTIIPRARMGSESIAHDAEGRKGYWLRGHEGERNNCFSKIELVGQKYREWKNFS